MAQVSLSCTFFIIYGFRNVQDVKADCPHELRENNLKRA